MSKRTIEVFTAGCACCDEAVQAMSDASCKSCDVRVLDMHDPQVAARARQLGIHRMPAVAVDGKLADCCATGSVDLAVLRGLGLGAG